MSRFIQSSRPLTFDGRIDANKLAEIVVDDPEGAAWTIVVLRDLLARNGLDVPIIDDAEGAI